MDSNTFMHHFYSPAEKHPQTLWGPRLPAKVETQGNPIHDTMNHGWCILIQEKPHWALFTALMSAGLVLSGLVAAIYIWIKADPQTGVTIGAWLIATEAMIITTVLFWWS